MEVIDRTRSVGNSILEAPRAAIERGRSNPRLAVAAIAGALLLIAWIAWAIYVTSDKGGNAGLGVVLSWPVLLGALALIASPFVGLYLLVSYLGSGDEAEEASSISGGSEDADSEAGEETEDEDDVEREDEAADEDTDDDAGGDGEDEDEDSDDDDGEGAGEGAGEADEPEETDPDEEPPSGEKAQASD